MKTHKLLTLALLVGVAGAFFASPDKAFAATRTWIGTDCPATNCNWSNTNNWQGGTVPVNGDDVVIVASFASPNSSESTLNDIANLSLASLSVSGYVQVDGSSVVVQNAPGNVTPLTLTGDVTYTAPTAAAPAGWFTARSLSLSHTAITLGDNSYFTQVKPDEIDTYNLGGHALTFRRTLGDNGTADSSTNFAPLITGSGTLNLEVPIESTLFMNGTNTYSGTTNITSADYVSTPLSSPGIAMFGTSVVNLSGSARVLFKADGAQTISNQFNITPPSVTGTFLSNQLEFWANSAPVTYTVPNITLLGNARFGVNYAGGSVLVNLAGINANGHCVQYGNNNLQTEYFQNGPTACTVNVAEQITNAPDAPNTGLQRLSSNPLAIAAVATLATVALIYLARKYTSQAH